MLGGRVIVEIQDFLFGFLIEKGNDDGDDEADDEAGDNFVEGEDSVVAGGCSGQAGVDYEPGDINNGTGSNTGWVSSKYSSLK